MGPVELGAVDLEPELAEAMAQAALCAGLTVEAWRRRAYEEQLQREKLWDQGCGCRPGAPSPPPAS